MRKFSLSSQKFNRQKYVVKLVTNMQTHVTTLLDYKYTGRVPTLLYWVIYLVTCAAITVLEHKFIEYSHDCKIHNLRICLYYRRLLFLSYFLFFFVGPKRLLFLPSWVSYLSSPSERITRETHTDALHKSFPERIVCGCA